MSTLLKETVYSPKQLETHWINNIFHSHDLFCGCPKPLLHLLTVINRNSAAPKPESEIPNIQCLLTGETTMATTGDHGIEEGELEKLFAEDTEEDTG